MSELSRMLPDPELDPIDPELRVRVQADLFASLSVKDDAEIAEILLESVWGDMGAAEPESAIVLQAYERLARSPRGGL